MYAKAAWVLVVITAVSAAADTVATAEHTSLWSATSLTDHGWPFVPLAAMAGSVIGALIVSRYPRHLIGWLFLVLGSVEAVSSFAQSYGGWVLEADGPGTRLLAQLALWFSVLTGASLAFAGLAILFLTAPDGHPVSRRGRFAVGLAIAGQLLWTAGLLTVSPRKFGPRGEVDHLPLGVEIVTSVAILLIVAALVSGAVSFLIRLRRARGELRQQLRWIAVPTATFPVTVIFLLVVQITHHGNPVWYESVPAYITYLMLPICTGVAVLRHRLYDIDVIVNRAVVLTGGTIFAAVGYIAVVVGVGGIIGKSFSGFWPSLIATAFVALAFQPARRWLVRLADRLAYGPRAVPYEELADFSRKLGESADPDLLLPAVAGAAARAVRARVVAVELRAGDGTVLNATWPQSVAFEPSAAGTEFPVLDGGETLGSITVLMPSGRTLRRRDRGLLDDLSGQTALAFRGARLSAQLAAQVSLLDRRSSELAASRARLIAARDAERARLARTVQRRVVGSLENVPDDLAMLHERIGVVDAAPVLDRLIEQTTEALDELREITRGVFPAQLERSGLAAAIRTHCARTGTANILTIDEQVVGTRYDRRVELAAYLGYLEAVDFVSAPATVSIRCDDGVLTLQVVGGAPHATELELSQDRMDSLGGAVVMTEHNDGAQVVISIPVNLSEADAPLAMR